MVVRIVSLVFIWIVVSVSGDEIDLHAKFLELESIVKQQGIRIKDLEGTVEKHEHTIAKQHIKIEELSDIDRKSKNSLKTDSVISDTIENFQSDSKNTQYNDKVRRLLVENVPVNPSTVAFYSYLSQNEDPIGKHQSLIFDVVKTNFGNGYNKYTGAFIAPVNGVYVLTLTIFPSRSTITAVNIFHNNDVVGQIFGDMVHGNVLSGSTGIVVVKMNKGDSATVRTSSRHPSNGVLYSDVNMKTTFADRRLLVENIPLQPSTVAFYSYLGHNENNLSAHHSLIFDVVITNFGNGYSKHTGAFIAPVNGVYVLTLTIFPSRGTLTAINILRNSEVVGQVFGDMRNSGILSGSTATVVVTMNKGDAATVITSSIHPSSGILGSDANMKTSFAGWKIGDMK